jgi:hypothetical protein
MITANYARTITDNHLSLSCALADVESAAKEGFYYVVCPVKLNFDIRKILEELGYEITTGVAKDGKECQFICWSKK